MPDERTFGFSLNDATELLRGIGSQDSWFPEIKPRGGKGGGGGETIWFTIAEVLCPDEYEVTEKTLVVTADWYTGGCNKIPPGANYDGSYNVYDLCNYLIDQVDTDLIGTVGRATYHYPLEGDCEPRWIIDDLCGRPECE